MNLNEIRAEYPQYNDLSDQELVDGFHSKYYSDMDKTEFYSKIGYSPDEVSLPEITDIQAEGIAELARRKNFGAIKDLIDKIFNPSEETKEQRRMMADESMRKRFAPIEVLATMGTGAIAEPMAGIAGIAKTITSGPEEAEKSMNMIRDFFTYKPTTKEGQEALGQIGKLFEPVGTAMEKAESGLGDTVFEVTGSPTLAAAATTLPTVGMELLGAGLIKGSEKSLKGVRRLSKAKQASGAIELSTPTIDMLKDTARGLYREIDDLGAVIKPDSYRSLVENITKSLQKSGLDPNITPKSNQALKRMYDELGNEITVTKLDTLRRVAKNAIDPSNPSESNLARIITESIDDFMDNASGNILRPTDEAKDIGSKYKIARDLWGRARKSELVQEAFERARNQATGFENGLRTQFRAILNNKQKSKYFKDFELQEMKKVVRGTTPINTLKLIGKLGFSEGQATGLIGGSIGVGFGAYLGGPVGAVAVPIIGQVSKKLAKRLTAKNAEFADQVIRAGKDANKIARTYLENTPVNLRDPSELAQLLMKADIELSQLPETPFMRKARDIATDYRSLLAESAILTEAVKTTQKIELPGESNE